MKRRTVPFIILLALIMVFTLVGCGGSESTQQPAQTQQQQPAQTQQQTQQAQSTQTQQAQPTQTQQTQATQTQQAQPTQTQQAQPTQTPTPTPTTSAKKLTATITSDSGLAIDDGDRSFSGTLEVKVNNGTNEDEDDIVLDVGFEADEDIPDVSTATLTGGNLTWTFTEQEDNTLWFTNSSTLAVTGGNSKTLTLTLKVTFEDEVDEDTTFSPSVELAGGMDLSSTVISTSGLEIDNGDGTFSGNLAVKVTNNSDEDYDNIGFTIGFEASGDIPDADTAKLTGGDLTWTFDDQDGNTLWFVNSTAMELAAGDSETLSLTLKVAFESDVTSDITFDPEIDIAEAGEVSISITSSSDLNVDDGDDSFSGTLVVKATNKTNEDIDDLVLNVIFEADNDIPDIKTAKLTCDDITWTFDGQDDNELWFSNSTAISIDKDDSESLSLTLKVTFEDDVDEDITFDPSVKIPDDLIAIVSSASDLDIDDGESTFTGTLVLKLTNYSEDDLDDIDLDILLEADADIPDVSSATLTGGGITWTFDDQDDTELSFSNSTDITLDAGDSETLTLTLTVTFDDEVDDDTSFDPSVEADY